MLLMAPSHYLNQGLEYGGVVAECVHLLGTTVPQMTLESQTYTKVVMPHPDDALLRHDDLLLWRHIWDEPEMDSVVREITKSLAEYL